jgi:hypothetical protein
MQAIWKHNATWGGQLGFCKYTSYGAFTLDVKSVLNENLGGILGGTQC